MSRFAAVGDGVFVSDAEFCSEYGHAFNVVHVYRESNRVEKVACPTCMDLDGECAGLRIRWREGEPLSKMSVSIEEFVAFAQRPGRTLIHCRGGICRSPTLAVLAKVARGRYVWDALADVHRLIWEGYREPVWFMPEAQRELLAWAETARNPSIGT